MKASETSLPGVLRVEPTVFRDARGFFLETYHAERYRAAGLPDRFLQDNVSRSSRGVVRGLHYQWPSPQGKLVQVLAGEVFDVAVDIRPGSPHFGRWTSAILSGENLHQLWVPPGFAHGFATLSETAILSYKCTTVYDAKADAAIRFDDPRIGIAWPVAEPILSAKDSAAPRLEDVAPARLPAFP